MNPDELRFNPTMIIELLKQSNDIPNGIVADVVKQGLSKDIFDKIEDMGTQLGNASVLESWCDFHNTSPVAWEMYAGRVYFWNKKEVGRKSAPLKDDKGNPVIYVYRTMVQSKSTSTRASSIATQDVLRWETVNASMQVRSDLNVTYASKHTRF